MQFDDTVLSYLADLGQLKLIEDAKDYTADMLFDKYIWYEIVRLG